MSANVLDCPAASLPLYEDNDEELLGGLEVIQKHTSNVERPTLMGPMS